MRFERASVYEGIQIGVESTPGILVPANKKLLGMSLNMDNMTDIKEYTPQGTKFPTTAQVGKEFTSGRLEGVLCYNDMIYLSSAWLTSTTPSVPANNATWLVSATNLLTVGFTFGGQVLAPAAYAAAAAFQTAIGGLSSVGAGNVLVTGTPSTGWTIQFIGALSTTVQTIGTVTGTATATITAQATGTLTNRWTFITAPFGPDTINTLSIEKGAAGVSNQAKRAAFGFVDGMQIKYTSKEASFNGQICAQAYTDSFTMTTSPTNVSMVPVDFRSTNVYMGTSHLGVALLDRILEIEFGIQSKATGLMTLNANDPSFSNRIETKPTVSSRFFAEHDTNGQALIAEMRAGATVYTVVENLGPLIETGFPYRMKWTYAQRITKAAEADVESAFGHNLDCNLQYVSDLGTALMLEIDCPLSTL